MSNQLQVSGAAKIRSIQGPVVANSGVITALDGDATQYVRGDGTLADFPTSTGGGSSVSYYLNTSVSQGTIGGVAYKQLSKTPISGAGTDVTISANGYVASYITDANDPALLEVPAGNFNCEFYFSVDSNAHNPYFYAELYKYDGTTFTLLGSSQSVPEYLTNGTTISPYYFAIPVATAVLTVTDRIAIRIYVNVDTRTVTLHTENNHLCQVVTTFSKGLISLNNLTRQNQFFQTGTSGTDFNISSATATHTFNIPVASAANTGKLSSTDWSTFNGKVPYTGATGNVDLGLFSLKANGILAYGNGTAGGVVSFTQTGTLSGIATGVASIGSVSAGKLNIYFGDAGLEAAILDNSLLTADRTYNLPNASGTLALLESTQTFTGTNTFGFIKADNGVLLKNGVVPASTGYTGIGAGIGTGIDITMSGSIYTQSLYFQTSAAYIYTFPAATGTLALTSNITSAISGTTNYHAKFTGTNTIGNSLIWDNGTNVGIGNTNTSYTLDVSGTGRFTSSLGVGSAGAYASTTLLVRSNSATSTNWAFIAEDNATNQIFGIRNNGNVGIGGVTPSAWYTGYTAMQLGASASIFGNKTTADTNVTQLANNAYLNTAATNWQYINTDEATRYEQVNGEHNFYSVASGSAGGNITWGTSKMTIKSSGNVGIGTSSPDSYDAGANKFVVSNSGGGGITIATGTSSIGALYFADGTTGSDPYRGFFQYRHSSDSLEFGTAASLKMTITSGGLVAINTTSATYGEIFKVVNSGASANTAFFLFNSSDDRASIISTHAGSTGGTSRNHVEWKNSSFGSVGSVSVNGTSTAYNTTSDYRLKEDFKQINGLDKVLAIKVYDFKWKDVNARMDGVIAHELAEVLPYAVNGEKDAERMQGVDYSKLVPVLVKAIQEMNTKLDEQNQTIQNLQEQINILAK